MGRSFGMRMAVQGAVALVLALVAGAPVAAVQLRASDFDELRGREIGPAGMSGRVTAVDVVLSDPNVVFVGAATGGVWRSEDGGMTWDPVFDNTRQLGVGSLAVFQRNPDIVWVGTGEGNPRNSAGVGVGIYKSIDGGDTWTHMGLEDSERIHRVVPHPTDPDVVYAGVMGPAWSDGEVRGVYRTTDGGESWERILWRNPSTGVADLVMDPINPNKLFAAMWEFRRWPWFFESGGEGSGLFVTHDGGDSWTELTSEQGLPEGELGRIGLGIAPSDPDVVYALVEAERSELLRSDDGGRTWRTISDRSGVAPRPFYYADLRVDPQNENRIYSLHSAIQVSQDAGRTFETVVPSQIIHGDVHELWIDPADGSRMIIGNDGGIGFTTDRGGSWRFVENLPLAQFYRMEVDDAHPFNVYGGLQDNGSWWGPNTVWEGRGVMNAHWRRVGGGDGFHVVPDLGDPTTLYAASQGGALTRVDRETGRRVSIRPVHPDGIPLRFNWNAAFSTDPHDPSVIYLGSQFVHRSTDQGRSWEVMSPDLTTNDPSKQRFDESGGLTLDTSGAETHTTLIDIAPSPIDDRQLWASSDDGLVHVSRDDGGSWTDVTGALRDAGLPEGIWVPVVEPSRHDSETAYVVAEDHRRGDWTPFIFRTRDSGESWNRLDTSEIDGFVHVIREDPTTPDLLLAGTEFGLWVSLNGGRDWSKFTHGVPPVPIRDLQIHPRDFDVALGTHGRAVVMIDDIRPWQALAARPEIAGEPLTVLPMAPAQKFEVADGFVGTDKGYRVTGHTMQFGELRPYGALLNVWSAEAGDATIEVMDAVGGVMAAWDHRLDRGFNRIGWGLEGDGGDEVLGGTYTVRVTRGEASSEGTLAVREDPREPIPVSDRLAKLEALERARALSETLGRARDRVEEGQEALEVILSDLDRGEDDLREAAQGLLDALRELDTRHFSGPECQGGCGPTEPWSGMVRAPLGRMASSDEAPTPNERVALELAEQALDRILGEVNDLFGDRVEALRAMLIEAGHTPLPSSEPIRVGGGDAG